MTFSDFIFLPAIAFLSAFLVGYVILGVYAFIRNSI